MHDVIVLFVSQWINLFDDKCSHLEEKCKWWHDSSISFCFSFCSLREWQRKIKKKKQKKLQQMSLTWNVNYFFQFVIVCNIFIWVFLFILSQGIRRVLSRPQSIGWLDTPTLWFSSTTDFLCHPKRSKNFKNVLLKKYSCIQ